MNEITDAAAAGGRVERRIERGHAATLRVAQLGVAEEPGCDRFAVLCFADLERTTNFVMRFVEALGDTGRAHDLDRFGDMELWVCSQGVSWSRHDGAPSAIYASEGAVRAFEELALERAQVGWVDAEEIPPNRLLVFRYAPEKRSAA